MQHCLYFLPLAAAMTARVELERQLTTLALKQPKFGEYWKGINLTADWLFARQVIRTNTHASAIDAADIGNRAAHGMPVTKTEVARMFNAVTPLRHTVRRKGGRHHHPVDVGSGLVVRPRAGRRGGLSTKVDIPFCVQNFTIPPRAGGGIIRVSASNATRN